MVEVIKIMVKSSKRSCACNVILGALNPAAGHHRPIPLLETPGNLQTSLVQSLEGSLLLSPGSWCTQGSVCALQASVSPVLCKSCNQVPLAFKVKSPGGSQSLCQKKLCVSWRGDFFNSQSNSC